MAVTGALLAAGAGAGSGAAYLKQINAFAPASAPVIAAAPMAPNLLAPGVPETVMLPASSPDATPPGSNRADQAPGMTAVPEPASLLTFMVGGLACILTRRRALARRRAG